MKALGIVLNKNKQNIPKTKMMPAINKITDKFKHCIRSNIINRVYIIASDVVFFIVLC